MRLALLAVAGVLALAPVARAGDEAPSLEAAERLEREAKQLLEHGHRVEGAKAMAKAWAIRAEAWSHAAKHDEAQQREAQVGDALRKGGAWAEKKVAELKARSNEMERAAKEAKAAGRADEAKEKMEASARLWTQAEAVEKALARGAEKGGGPDSSHEQLARLKERSAALEREAHAAREAGREKEAEEKARASGRAWAEAREIERAMGETRGPGEGPMAELRRTRARMQARAEELEAKLRKLEAATDEGEDARRREVATEIEALRGKIAHLDRSARDARRGEARPDGHRRGPDGGHGLAAAVEALRAQVAELRAAVEELRRRREPAPAGADLAKLIEAFAHRLHGPAAGSATDLSRLIEQLARSLQHPPADAPAEPLDVHRLLERLQKNLDAKREAAGEK